MINMNLNEILKKHEMWLEGEKGGERANLSGYDLININLSGADLINANLRDVEFGYLDISLIQIFSAKSYKYFLMFCVDVLIDEFDEF